MIAPTTVSKGGLQGGEPLFPKEQLVSPALGYAQGTFSKESGSHQLSIFI